MAFLIGQGVLADEIAIHRFVRRRGQIAGLRQQLDLQRQQIAEDARQGDDHVDARAPEFGERNELRAR